MERKLFLLSSYDSVLRASALYTTIKFCIPFSPFRSNIFRDPSRHVFFYWLYQNFQLSLFGFPQIEFSRASLRFLKGMMERHINYRVSFFSHLKRKSPKIRFKLSCSWTRIKPNLAWRASRLRILRLNSDLCSRVLWSEEVRRNSYLSWCIYTSPPSWEDE